MKKTLTSDFSFRILRKLLVCKWKPIKDIINKIALYLQLYEGFISLNLNIDVTMIILQYSKILSFFTPKRYAQLPQK